MTVLKQLFPMDLQYFAENEPAQPVEPAEPETKVEVQEQQPPQPEVQEEPPAPVKQEKAVEKPDPRITELEAELAALKADKEKLSEEVTGKATEATSAAEKVSEYEATLKHVVEEKLANIPESIAALMPENISVAEQLQWVDKAEKAIPEKETKPAEPAVKVEAIGKPTPVQTVETPIENLTASQKLQNYFQAFFEK